MAVIPSLPPYHLVDNADVGLDDLHDLGGDILIYIVGDGKTVVALFAEFNGGIDGLEERLRVNTGNDEVTFVDGFGPFRTGSDADGREGVADAGEKAALFGQRTAIAHDGKGIHLKAVVVVEAQRFVLNDSCVELEAACGQSVAASGVTAVENRHVVFGGHLVDRIEQRQEVLLRIDVLLPMGGQQDVFSLFQTQPLVDIAGFDGRQVLMQHFGHRTATDVGTFFGQTTIGQISSGMFRIGDVHIGDDIDNASVGLLGQAFVLATVAGLHVEDGDVQTLRPYHTQAAVGVAQHQNGIGFRLVEELVAAVDDVATGGSQVIRKLPIQRPIHPQ